MRVPQRTPGEGLDRVVVIADQIEDALQRSAHGAPTRGRELREIEKSRIWIVVVVEVEIVVIDEGEGFGRHVPPDRF